MSRPHTPVGGVRIDDVVHRQTVEDPTVINAALDGPAPRILLLTERVPGHDTGFGLRIGNLIDGLCNVGDLHVCLIDSTESGVTMRPSGQYATSTVRAREVGVLAFAGHLARMRPPRLRYRSPRTVRRDIVAAVGRTDWDLVVCCRCRVHLASEGLFDAPRIVDFDDLNDALLESRIRDRTALKGRIRTLPRNLHDRLHVVLWRRLQRTIARHVERVGVCSEHDAARVPADNVVVIPNGYPDPGVTSHAAASSSNRMLFVGPLTYEPNRLAVEWFVEQVLPAVRAVVPGAELIVLGAKDGVSIDGAGTAGVTFAGYVPDVAPYYRSASIAVVPLHSGGGTRIKVIEGLARSVPIVTTSFGCFGHGLVSGRDAILADTADEFAAACIELLGDATLRERIAAGGRQLFEERLTSATTSRAIADVARAVLDPRFAAHPCAR